MTDDRRQRAREAAIACAEKCRDAIWAWYQANQPEGPVEMDFLVNNFQQALLAFADAEPGRLTVVYVEGHDGKPVAAPCCLDGCQYESKASAPRKCEPYYGSCNLPAGHEGNHNASVQRSPLADSPHTARQLAEVAYRRMWGDIEEPFHEKAVAADDIAIIEAAILDSRKELEAQLEELEGCAKQSVIRGNRVIELERVLVDMKARLASMTAERDQENRLKGIAVEVAADYKAKLARVTAALGKYGKHEPDCPHYEYDAFTCLCGLETVLKGDE